MNVSMRTLTGPLQFKRLLVKAKVACVFATRNC